MTRETRKTVNTIVRYVVLIVVGFIMIYPLIWMVGATFKTNNEIFSGIGFIPKNPTLDGYKNALKSYGGDIDIFKAMINTYSIVLPKVVFTIVSATITAYGFARFEFRGKKLLFAVLMSTIYLALIVPTMFATDTYFVFMLIQFLRNIPKELEEAATIDGCGSVKTLWYVIVPMLKPSIVSCALFQFMWSSNDFMGPLLYVNTPARYPASIFVKMSMDADTGFEWNRVLAMSLISIIPSLIVFLLAQDQFIDGIAAGGVKG